MSNEAQQQTHRPDEFEEIGRGQEPRLTNGQIGEVILMDCLASEFESRNFVRGFGLDQA